MSNEAELVPVFTPMLGAVLLAAEDDKGAPLTVEETEEIRDGSNCIMMERTDANEMQEKHGIDVDPENCWYDWQMLRRELGRKPDLDPGARIEMVRSSSPEYQAAITDAQNTLGQCREHFVASTSSLCSVKTRMTGSHGSAFVWLSVIKAKRTEFVGELFEVPEALRDFEIGQSFSIKDTDIIDWMANDDGVLHGGFTLRLHRSTLSESEQADFDRFIGVHEYAKPR